MIVNESEVCQLVWGYFSEDEDIQGFTKNEGELNAEIKEKFGYDAQLQIEEVGSSYDTNYDQWFYAITYLDEKGKLQFSSWSKEIGDVPDRFY